MRKLHLPSGIPHLNKGVAVAALLALSGCQGAIGAQEQGGGPGMVLPPTQQTPVPGAGGSAVVPSTPEGNLVATRTPLRRLSREQYNRTVRDLLGIEADDYASGFGVDEEVGGFASNLSVPVSAAQVETYAEAARRLAQIAVSDANLSRLVPCAAAAAPGSPAESACALEFVTTFGKRAFRRPLAQPEIDRYLAVHATGDDFSTGVRLVITAMLQSPYFFYLPELGQAAPGAQVLPLSQYEVATRLSYFLRGSMPDAELFRAADAGELVTPEQLAAQARRILAAPEGTEMLIDFHRQWAMLNDVTSAVKSEDVYPEYGPELARAMDDEVSAFVTGVLRDGDGTLGSLLTANYSFVEGPLYDIYGVDAPAGASGPTRVDLPAGERSGLFTLPATLTTFAHTDSSSPVARGFLVSE